MTENLHFIWHFCLWCLFAEVSHSYTINMFINGAINGDKRPCSGEVETIVILFAKLAALLPALEEKGITIPKAIHSFAKGVIVEELLSAQIQDAKEQFH
jgi:hypothetical protein